MDTGLKNFARERNRNSIIKLSSGAIPTVNYRRCQVGYLCFLLFKTRRQPCSAFFTSAFRNKLRGREQRALLVKKEGAKAHSIVVLFDVEANRREMKIIESAEGFSECYRAHRRFATPIITRNPPSACTDIMT